MNDSVIRDKKLAVEGERKIHWAQENMPLLRRIQEDFQAEKPFLGIRLGMSIHLEAKTAFLARVLAAGGAEVAVTGSNPLSTQDDVAAALAEGDIRVYSWYNATSEEYEEHLNKVLDNRPAIIIDDGGDLIHLLYTRRQDLLPEVIGAAEETTTGMMRLRAMQEEGVLQFPVLAINDARCKHLFDNRYGTGQSVWDGIMRTTNLIISGKQVVIAGFGWCGKGCAVRAKGLGAQVIVCETDPVLALEAVMEGYRVMSMEQAAPLGDIFITVTGCRDVIARKHLEKMKDGAILANAGHFDVEINIPDLEAMAEKVQEVRKNITGYQTRKGHWIYLLARGRLVNLAAADGHPVEIMDLSFALQALGAKYIRQHYQELKPCIYPVPEHIDRFVAALKLETMGIVVDELSQEQKNYLRSWGQG